MKLTVRLYPDEEDGGFTVTCPEIPGCISQGDTEEEALANIEEAILACLDVRRELEMPLTVKTHELDIAV